jgi:hypothetical protein
MERSEVIAYLQKLNQVELIRTFYDVVRPLRETYFVESDGRHVVEEALVVASASFLDAGEGSTGVLVVALPFPEYESSARDTLCQSGRCDRCQALVVGFEKVGYCPICLSEVGLT